MPEAPRARGTESGPRAGSWRLLGYAALLGVVGVVAGLVFISVTEPRCPLVRTDRLRLVRGPRLVDPRRCRCRPAGRASAAATCRCPSKMPGLVEDLAGEHVERKAVASIVAVSAVSLVGGASLGPEVALGQIGGGSGGPRRRSARARRGRHEGPHAQRAGGSVRRPLLQPVACVLPGARGRAARARDASSEPSSGRSSHRASRSAPRSPSPAACSSGIYEVPAYEYDGLAAAGRDRAGAARRASTVVLLAVIGSHRQCPRSPGCPGPRSPSPSSAALAVRARRRSPAAHELHRQRAARGRRCRRQTDSGRRCSPRPCWARWSRSW